MAKPNPFSKSRYFVQPDGTWKKGGDGRSPGKTLKELKDMKVPAKKIK